MEWKEKEILRLKEENKEIREAYDYNRTIKGGVNLKKRRELIGANNRMIRLLKEKLKENNN